MLPKCLWEGLVGNNPKKKCQGYKWGFEYKPKGKALISWWRFGKMRVNTGYMLGMRTWLDTYWGTYSGSNERKDTPNRQLLHLAWEKWRLPMGVKRKKNVGLRAILGENSLYRHTEGSFRKISKGLRVDCKEERFEKKGPSSKYQQGLITSRVSIQKPHNVACRHIFPRGALAGSLCHLRKGPGRNDLLLSAMPTAGQSGGIQAEPGIF